MLKLAPLQFFWDLRPNNFIHTVLFGGLKLSKGTIWSACIWPRKDEKGRRVGTMTEKQYRDNGQEERGVGKTHAYVSHVTVANASRCVKNKSFSQGISKFMLKWM